MRRLDFFTIALHWVLAITVIVSYFLIEPEVVHKTLGYLAAGAVVVRLLKTGHTSHHIHPFRNVLAKSTYVLIWITVILLAVSGFMMETDAFWGVAWVQDSHRYLSFSIVALVALHLAGVVVDSILHKRMTALIVFGKEK